MQKSTPSSSRSDGSRDSTARRPGAPNTSATKRILSSGYGPASVARRVAPRSRRGCPASLRVAARAPGARPPERSTTRPSFESRRPCTGEPTASDGSASTCGDRDDERRARWSGWMSIRDAVRACRSSTTSPIATIVPSTGRVDVGAGRRADVERTRRARPGRPASWYQRGAAAAAAEDARGNTRLRSPWFACGCRSASARARRRPRRGSRSRSRAPAVTGSWICSAPTVRDDLGLRRAGRQEPRRARGRRRSLRGSRRRPPNAVSSSVTTTTTATTRRGRRRADAAPCAPDGGGRAGLGARVAEATEATRSGHRRAFQPVACRRRGASAAETACRPTARRRRAPPSRPRRTTTPRPAARPRLRSTMTTLPAGGAEDRDPALDPARRAAPAPAVLAWVVARRGRHVVFLFLIAALIALLLDPLVRALQRGPRPPRGLSVAIVYLTLRGCARRCHRGARDRRRRPDEDGGEPRSTTTSRSVDRTDRPDVAADRDVDRLQHWLNTHHLQRHPDPEARPQARRPDPAEGRRQVHEQDRHASSRARRSRSARRSSTRCSCSSSRSTCCSTCSGSARRRPALPAATGRHAAADRSGSSTRSSAT